MKDVAVVGYCRTGIARAFRGALNQTHGIPLAAHVLKEAVARAGVESGEVADIVLGCGLPQGATGHNIGRTAALEAGFDVPGVTVNRYCGSGLTAASMIASRIATGEIFSARNSATLGAVGGWLSMGALVTTHKVNLLKASRDLFDELDPYAVTLHEISSISKRGGRLVGGQGLRSPPAQGGGRRGH